MTLKRKITGFMLMTAMASMMSVNAYADEKTDMAEKTAETAAAAADTAEALADLIAYGNNGESILSGTFVQEQAESGLRDQIAAYAKQFVGGRYRYGGTSLTSGVDCSGFVMRIFQNFGINTGRDSRTQASVARTKSASEIMPGDVVFYGSGGRVNHVGIYIGEGLIVHASNERTGIKISSMYYRTPMKIGTFI